MNIVIITALLRITELLDLGLAQEDEELSHDAGRDLAEVLLPEGLLVLHDEELGGLQQDLSLVDLGEAEQLDHILQLQTPDGQILSLSFHWEQVVEVGEGQEAGEIGFQNLLRD